MVYTYGIYTFIVRGYNDYTPEFYTMWSITKKDGRILKYPMNGTVHYGTTLEAYDAAKSYIDGTGE